MWYSSNCDEKWLLIMICNRYNVFCTLEFLHLRREYHSPHGLLAGIGYGRTGITTMVSHQGAGNRMRHPTSVGWRICRKFIFNVSCFFFKQMDQNNKNHGRNREVSGNKKCPNSLIKLFLHINNARLFQDYDLARRIKAISYVKY